jgi:hypothetical protein
MTTKEPQDVAARQREYRIGLATRLKAIQSSVDRLTAEVASLKAQQKLVQASRASRLDAKFNMPSPYAD